MNKPEPMTDDQLREMFGDGLNGKAFCEIAKIAIAARDAQWEQMLNTPELHDFTKGVPLEALHQRQRWGSEHDARKTPADWFWLVGYLAGKALHAQNAGNTEKALHHTISTAAALANWHASITGAHTAIQPGIDAALAVTQGA